MCLLGVSMMNNHIYGSKVPQNPHFGGLNRHFKANTRKIQIAISSDLCIRLTWNLTCSCGQQHRLRGWSRMVVKQFQDGGRPPFWKLLYRHISAKNHLISMTLCTQQQILTGWTSRGQKWKRCIGQTPNRTYFLLIKKLVTPPGLEPGSSTCCAAMVTTMLRVSMKLCYITAVCKICYLYLSLHVTLFWTSWELMGQKLETFCWKYHWQGRS